MHTPWHVFSRPYVKDLAYALACPSALLAFPKAFTELARQQSISLPSMCFWDAAFMRYLPRLKQLDDNPKPLNRFIHEHLISHRLGFRFETLLLFWLQDTQYHDFELIGHNLQIFAGNATVGELDFIVRNKATGEIEHWELALKHYLAHPPYTTENFIGLNEKDTLAKKLTHMLSKQFRFDEVNVDGVNYKIDARRAIIKGRFFLPFTLYHQAVPDSTANDLVSAQLPRWLNPNFPLGLWQHHARHMTQQQTFNYRHWRRARRIEWLTKRDFLDDFELGTHPKQLGDEVAKFSGQRVPLQLGKGLYFHVGKSQHKLMDTQNQSQIKNQPQIDSDWLVFKA